MKIEISFSQAVEGYLLAANGRRKKPELNGDCRVFCG